MKIFILIILTLFVCDGILRATGQSCAEYERCAHKAIDQKDTLNTSIIIPCCAQHAPYLYPLLKLYQQQTVLPDEIVISLSGAKHVEKNILYILENDVWYFPITLLLSKDTLFPGGNRNIACAYATGDIFICQDADDIPHPQRVEIIKYFFKTYEIDHLMHQLVCVAPHDVSIPFVHYETMDSIRFISNEKFESILNSASFTNGNIAIARHVFNSIQWPSDIARGEDTTFNNEIYRKCKDCFAIEAILLGYREFLSSTSNMNGQTRVKSHLLRKNKIRHTHGNLYSLQIIQLG